MDQFFSLDFYMEGDQGSLGVFRGPHKMFPLGELTAGTWYEINLHTFVIVAGRSWRCRQNAKLID